MPLTINKCWKKSLDRVVHGSRFDCVKSWSGGSKANKHFRRKEAHTDIWDITLLGNLNQNTDPSMRRDLEPRCLCTSADYFASPLYTSKLLSPICIHLALLPCLLRPHAITTLRLPSMAARASSLRHVTLRAGCHSNRRVRWQ